MYYSASWVYELFILTLESHNILLFLSRLRLQTNIRASPGQLSKGAAQKAAHRHLFRAGMYYSASWVYELFIPTLESNNILLFSSRLWLQTNIGASTGLSSKGAAQGAAQRPKPKSHNGQFVHWGLTLTVVDDLPFEFLIIWLIIGHFSSDPNLEPILQFSQTLYIFYRKLFWPIIRIFLDNHGYWTVVRTTNVKYRGINLGLSNPFMALLMNKIKNDPNRAPPLYNNKLEHYKALQRKYF